MEQKEITVKINQSINYHDSNEKQNWQLTTSAQATFLKTYTKFTYQTDQGEVNQLKWLASKNFLELIRPSGTLRFQEGHTHPSIYRTPYGDFELLVKTTQLSYDPVNQTIDLTYQIIQEEKPFADYRFELICGE